MSLTSRTVNMVVQGVGPVSVALTERGAGRPFLLLHGGPGPQSVSTFADLLAETAHVRVIAPTHPGFGLTPRPEGLATVRGLAALYVALIDELDLADVIVVGNSMGGWIAAEMALQRCDRIGGIVLVGAVGIEVPELPVADFFSLTLEQVVKRSYHDPSAFRLDPSAMSAEQRAIMAGNRSALAVYGGTPPMVDLTLRDRLQAVTCPSLVVWGESDRVVHPDYGRAYAAAIPAAGFELLEATGHVPQIETPERLLGAIQKFANDDGAGRSAL
ncbi:MAG: alpha/beta hydrolase [Chloroflexota bacterium]